LFLPFAVIIDIHIGLYEDLACYVVLASLIKIETKDVIGSTVRMITLRALIL